MLVVVVVVMLMLGWLSVISPTDDDEGAGVPVRFWPEKINIISNRSNKTCTSCQGILTIHEKHKNKHT